MDQNSAGHVYLTNMSPKISNAKIKEGLFVRPQIREAIQNIKFEDQLSELEKATWKSFKNININFWEIIRQKIIAVWWLVLYNCTKQRNVCLETYISWAVTGTSS